MMIKLIKMLFTWWHGQTLGTWLLTQRRGFLVGWDMQGNRYYIDKYGDRICGKPRRWVIYNGDVEASRVPPDWHGWLHYTTDDMPDDEDVMIRKWHKPHQQNRTGTSVAHHPRGMIDSTSPPQGYQAWIPDADQSENKKMRG